MRTNTIITVAHYQAFTSKIRNYRKLFIMLFGILVTSGKCFFKKTRMANMAKEVANGQYMGKIVETPECRSGRLVPEPVATKAIEKQPLPTKPLETNSTGPTKVNPTYVPPKPVEKEDDYYVLPGEDKEDLLRNGIIERRRKVIPERKEIINDQIQNHNAFLTPFQDDERSRLEIQWVRHIHNYERDLNSERMALRKAEAWEFPSRYCTWLRNRIAWMEEWRCNSAPRLLARAEEENRRRNELAMRNMREDLESSSMRYVMEQLSNLRAQIRQREAATRANPADDADANRKKIEDRIKRELGPGVGPETVTEDCIICMDKDSQPDRLFYPLKCCKGKNRLHLHCLTEAILVQPTCPFCRGPIFHE